MKIRKTAIAVILFLGMSGIVSCSIGQEAGSAVEAPSDVYRIEKEIVLDLDAEALPNSFMTDDCIYYNQQSDGESGSCLWKRELAEEAEASIIFASGENEVVETFAVTDAGNVIAAVRNTEQGVTELRKLNRAGEAIWRSEYPEQDGALYISQILVGDDGRIYTSSQQEIFFWNASGELENCVTVKGEMIQQLADAGENRIAAVQYKQGRQSLTVYEGTDGAEIFQKDFQEQWRWFGEGLHCQEDMLVQYQWENDSSEAILNFTDSGVIVSNVYLLRPLSEGRFLLAYEENDNTGIHFVWLAAGELQTAQPKVQLVMASFNAQNLQNSIVRFNRSHEDYELVCKDFDIDYSSRSGMLGSLDRFNAYMVSDNPPDIIDLFEDMHTYVRDGYLLDLTPYIEKSDKIDLEELLPRVRKDIMVDGKIYAVPQTMSISAIACPTALLEGKNSWTIEEYLDLLEQYPNARTEKGASAVWNKKNILREVLLLGMDGFIDWETGESFFDGEEFCSILERINGLEISETMQSQEERALNGEMVFWSLNLSRANKLLIAEWCSGQELTLIGYPVSGRTEGAKSRNIISYSDWLGIHSATEEADAAWDCVEAHIEGALQKNDFHFTTGSKAFEERIQEDVGAQTFADGLVLPENAQELEAEGIQQTALGAILPETTQEQADKVKTAYFEGVYVFDDNEPLLNIISEETEPYFRGEKALEDVVNIIQNRIQIYIKERK